MIISDNNFSISKKNILLLRLLFRLLIIRLLDITIFD